MFPNAKPSETMAVLGVISPVATSTTVNSGWISAQDFHKFMAVIQTGVLGASATVDSKVQQAVDSSGTSAKDMTGKAITQIVKASGDNKQALINFGGFDFDVNNAFCYFQLSITVGTASSLVSAAILGVVPRYADASTYNPASVVQVV